MRERTFRKKQNKYQSFMNSENNHHNAENKCNEEFCTFQDTFTLQKNNSF